MSADDRELDAKIVVRFFGWTWIQAPQFDYNGPLPEQGKCLVSPEMRACIDSGEYQWPRRGIVPPLFFSPPHFSTDPGASKMLREKLAELFTVFVMRTTNGSTTVEVWNEIPQDFAPTKFVDHQIGKGPTEELAVRNCALKLGANHE